MLMNHDTNLQYNKYRLHRTTMDQLSKKLERIGVKIQSGSEL